MDFDFHGGEIKEKIEYDFSVNINPLGMPSYVKEAMIGSIDSLVNYPDRLCVELKRRLAELEDVKEEQILCGNGASELIMAVCASAATNALIMAPTFSGYERAIKVYGGEVSYYKSSDELINLLSNDNDYNLLFICNPNNPTGEIIERQRLIQIIGLAKEKNIKVVLDECFIDFTHEESLSNVINEYDNLVILKAFTKFYGLAGVRLGYVISDEKLCKEIGSFLPEWNVSGIAQAAGIAAVSDKRRVDEWKRKTIGIVDVERKYLTSSLNDMGIETSDSKANFILCKSIDNRMCESKENKESNTLWEKLKAQGILVRDCSNFPGLDKSYFRICVSTHEKNMKLIDTIKDLI